VGAELGKGRPLAEIIAEMKMVAEGVKSSKVVCELGRSNGVEMPIADEVQAVCHEGRTAVEALSNLMQRQQRAETHGLAT